MFDFDLSDEFRKTLKKLSRKNPIISDAISRKIKEVISRDKQSVMMYKNLRHDLKHQNSTISVNDGILSVLKNHQWFLTSLKRVHITEWLVMTFEVDLNKNFILFVKIAHRDDIYKK